MFSPDMSTTEMGGYPGPGELQDIADHEAMMMPQPGHSPAVQHSTKMAGDVIPIPGEDSMGQGPTEKAIDYALGRKTDSNVRSIGMNTLKGFADRYGKRK